MRKEKYRLEKLDYKDKTIIINKNNNQVVGTITLSESVSSLEKANIINAINKAINS